MIRQRPHAGSQTLLEKSTPLYPLRPLPPPRLRSTPSTVNRPNLHPQLGTSRLNLAQPHMVAAASSSLYRLLRVASASGERGERGEAELPLPVAHFRGRLRKPTI